MFCLYRVRKYGCVYVRSLPFNFIKLHVVFMEVKVFNEDYTKLVNRMTTAHLFSVPISMLNIIKGCLGLSSVEGLWSHSFRKGII